MGSPPSISRLAPATARFLLAALSDHLPFARRLIFGAPLSAADGGDGGDYTVTVSGATHDSRGVVKLNGQLGGAADAPDVRGLRITGGDGSEGPQLLTIGAVKTMEALIRDGAAIVSAPVLGTGGGAMSGDINMNGHKLTNLPTGADPGDAATFGQLTSMLNGLDWQASVLEVRGTVPSSPADGDRGPRSTTPRS